MKSQLTFDDDEVLTMEIQESRLEQQLDFILEIDRLKTVLRETLLTDSSRKENSAEHSWQLAVMVIVFSEYADDEIDLKRVLKMVVIHDLVEIDAGDTYAYNHEAQEDKEEREREAAERIFGLLPSDQAQEFRTLWEEFESRETSEAMFAKAIDRLQPLILNYHTGGESWKDHDVRLDDVLDRNEIIQDGSERLWAYTEQLIEAAVERGMLKTDANPVSNDD
jgi:putative hydrolase of HD superfamily